MDPVSASYGAWVAPPVLYTALWLIIQIVIFVVMMWTMFVETAGSKQAHVYKTLLEWSKGAQKHISVGKSRFCMVANATHPPWRPYKHRLVHKDPALFLISPTAPASNAAILYIHGGGLIFGGVKTCEWVAGQLADNTGHNVYLPHYRLCPEHTADEALSDCLASYELLCEKYDKVAIVADSAGSYLAYGVASKAEHRGVPVQALVLISPMLNLHEDLRELHEDESFSSHSIKWCMNNVRASTLSALEWATPHTPLMLIAADDEMMMDDVSQLHRLRPDALVLSYKGVFHAFPKLDTPESRDAHRRIANFLMPL